MENKEDIKIGLLYSLTGTTGITERGQYQSTLLAIKHINEQGGVNGRRLVPVVEDISSDPFLAAKKAEKLILFDKVAVIIGPYTSACRRMVIPVLEKYNVLLLYPTLYEGEELSRNVFYCGPVPNQQLQFFIPWLIANLGKTFYLIGSDYIYPRETNRHIHRLVKAHDGKIIGECYSALGTQKFDNSLKEIIQTNPDIIFSTLVGESVVAFYQQFYQCGIKKPIASSITAETEIKVMGAACAVGHYTSFPYFNSISNEQNNRFCAEYRRTYGTDVISSVMENAYYCVFLLSEAMRKCNSVEADSLRRALSGLTFKAPQGQIKVDEKNQHLWLHSRIGRVNENGQFDIVWESNGPIAPIPFVNQVASDENKNVANNIFSRQEVDSRKSEYLSLIEKLKSATRRFPFTFAFFDNNGLLLEVFRNEDFGEPEAIPLLNPGVRWTSPLIIHSGVTLALTGHTEAVVAGKEHELEDLQDRITIGIPIKGITGSLVGVLGVFPEPDHLDKYPSDVVIRSLSPIVECCVETVKEVDKCVFLSKLSEQISEFIPESLFVVHNDQVLFSNNSAYNLLTKNKDTVRKIISEITDRTLETEIFTRKKMKDGLYEVRVTPAEKYRYVFIKKLVSEQHYNFKGTKILIRDLIGSNERFLRTVQLAASAASIDANVLILGESGTGKELFARAIHNESSRKNKPFVAINCGSVSRELINAELFGYTEGSFTGAKKGGNPGKFEVANGGTLFLDEIGDMPLELQATLLRVLQEREVVRIGGHQPIPVDVRIIAATNKNLNEEIAYKGSFRSDLYYRLNVFTIELIPLRERMDDIPELTNYFIAQLNATSGLAPKAITDQTVQSFLQYGWPGNIRELKNIVERAFYLSGNSPLITPSHLPSQILHCGEGSSPDNVPGKNTAHNNLVNIKRISKQLEQQNLTDLLLQYRGNLSKVAKQLGISRTTLYRRLKEYNAGNQ